MLYLLEAVTEEIQVIHTKAQKNHTGNTPTVLHTHGGILLATVATSTTMCTSLTVEHLCTFTFPPSLPPSSQEPRGCRGLIECPPAR